MPHRTVNKTRRVQKTRQIPGVNGGYATEVYYVDEPYTEQEYYSEPVTSNDTYTYSGE